MKLTNLKDWATTIPGSVIIALSVTSYYFKWPLDHPFWITAGEIAVALILIFSNKRQLATWLQSVLQSVISKKL